MESVVLLAHKLLVWERKKILIVPFYIESRALLVLESLIPDPALEISKVESVLHFY